METKSNMEDESLNFNTYIKYNDSIVFFDPTFIFIINRIKDGLDLNQILDLPSSLFPDNIKPDKTCIEYYIRKFEFFKYFSQKKSIKEKFIHLNEKDIESKIANLNQITFEITDSCNLNCHYCGYGDFYGNHDERKNTKLDIVSAKIILEYLINFWNSNSNISHKRNIYISFYGGEPLLNMDFIKEIVHFINSKTLIHNYITFSMTTNAILLEKNIDYLVKNNFKLLISLDGDKNNNSYRVFHNGSESFNIVYNNIKKVKDKFPEYFSKMININSVLHNRNSVSSIYTFIRNEFDKLPFISELNSMGIKHEKREEFHQTYQNKYESLNQAEDYTYIKKEMFYKVGESFEVGLFLHQHSGNIFHDYNDFFIDKNVIQRTPTGTCLPFGKKMFITVNGKILACEKIGHQYALGKVTHEGVELDFKKIATKYNNYYSKIIDQCNNCYNVESCMQCIFNLEDIEKKPVCKGFMDAQQFIGQVCHEISFLEKDRLLYDKIIQNLIIEM